jgi:benzil reductase ((S)-benzoin forming)
MRLLIINGGNSGLGAELLENFALMSDSIIVVGRNTVHENKIGSIITRISSENVVSELKEYSLENNILWDDILLINNAGILGEIGLIGDLKLDDFQDAVKINLLLPLELLNSVFSLLKFRKFDAINISSGVSLKPQPGWIIYSACKAFLNSLSRSINIDSQFRRESIFVNVRSVSINPGPIDTLMQSKIRNLNVETFPNVELFKNLYRTNTLRSAAIVASKIVELYKTDNLFNVEYIDFNDVKIWQ